MGSAGQGKPGEQLEVLRTLLESATRIAGDLASDDDPLIAQLQRIARKAPPEDLEILLGVLEREIDAKLSSDVCADVMTGLSLRPNPNARLYTRVIDREPSFERNEVILGTVRAMRSIHRAVEPKFLNWQTVTQEALRMLDASERRSVAQFCRVMLLVVDELERELAAGSRD